MQIAILLYYRFIITVLYTSKNSLSMARLFKHTKTFSNISFLQLYNIWYFVWTWSLLISFVIIILIWSNFANNVRWLTMQTCLKSQQKEMWIHVKSEFPDIVRFLVFSHSLTFDIIDLQLFTHVCLLCTTL